MRPLGGRYVAPVAVLSLLLLLLGWFVLVAPVRAHLHRLREERMTVAGENVALRQDLARLQARAADLPSRQARLDRLQGRIPGEARLPELIQQLAAASQSVGVELVSIVPGPVEPVPGAVPSGTPASSPSPPVDGTAGLQQVPLTVVARGGYVELTAFLDQVENLPRALIVDSITLGALPAEEASMSPAESAIAESMLSGTSLAPTPLGAGGTVGGSRSPSASAGPTQSPSAPAARPPGEDGRVELTVQGRAFVRPGAAAAGALAPSASASPRRGSARGKGTSTPTRSGSSAATPSADVPALPTSLPSAVPSAVPSGVPSGMPSAVPSLAPPLAPSAVPSTGPSAVPAPTSSPGGPSTRFPTVSPSPSAPARSTSTGTSTPGVPDGAQLKSGSLPAE